MRLDSRSRIVLIGCFLIATSHGSRVCGEGNARALMFRELTQSTNDTPRAPAAQQPAPPMQEQIAQVQPEGPAKTPPQAELLQSAGQQEATPALQPPRFYPRPNARPPVVTQPAVEPQLTGQARQALDYYGGYSARATLNQMPRRTPIQPSGPQPTRRPVKPFESVYEEPTISPYLNLYREETDATNAPNYFAFVRPQLEQIETNRVQQREIERLRGQLQRMPSVSGPQYQTPGTRTAARYMDTAQFYSSWSR